MISLPLGKSGDAPIQVKAGTVLFHEGEMSKYLIIVKKGEVKLLKKNGQHLHVIEVCKDRDILNEISVLTNQPLAFSAIAKTDTEVVLIEQKDIASVIKNGPEWVADMFETLCERLKSTMDMIHEHNLSEKNPELVLTKEEEKKFLEALGKK